MKLVVKSAPLLLDDSPKYTEYVAPSTTCTVLVHGGGPAREPYQTHQRQSSNQGIRDPYATPGGGAGEVWQGMGGQPQAPPMSQLAPAAPPPPSMVSQKPPSGPPAAPAPPAPPGGPPAPPVPPSGAASMGGAPLGGPPAPPAPPPPPPPPGNSGPPAPPAVNSAPAAPPPPAPSGGLAAALKNAQLKKVPKPDEEETKSNYASTTGTIGRGGRPIPGADDMMSEMAQRLAARRAKAEGLQTDDSSQNAGPDKKPWEKTVTQQMEINLANKMVQSHQKSAEGNYMIKATIENKRASRGSRRFQSLTGQETIFTTANGPSNPAPAAAVSSEQLENLKQEILSEMRKEVQKAKQEIIEAIKMEFTRR